MTEDTGEFEAWYFAVDRTRGDVPQMQALPPCDDPARPMALAIGPFEPLGTAG